MAVSVSAVSVPREDHRCFVFEDGVEFQQAAVEFLAEGLACGERVAYLADRSEADLARELSGLGDIDDLRDRGAVVLQSLLGLYKPGGAFDVREQIDRYRTLTQQALADGYTGLRVAADASALVESPEARRQFVRYEVAVDQLIAGIPMSAMCAYDVRRIGGGVRDLCAVHAEHNGQAELAPGFRLFFGDDNLRLDGEIDMSNADLFERSLDAAASCSDRRVVIDTSGLAFIDVRSIRCLAERRAALLADGRDLKLLNPRPLLHRCATKLDLQGLFEAPSSKAPE